MAIIGIGLDLIELSRMERSLHRFGEHFLNRIMADDERSAIPGDPASPSARAVSHVAARFAAKEAVAKALGAPGNMDWQDATVDRRRGERPIMVITGTVEAAAARLGVTRLHLSLSHDAGIASAVVVAEGD